jgi:regulator of protease activity HflC (stomatin/prohibitin superfamily)|tara:strand:- start:1411 stop:2331 length:921 start_codon:yes stop_codon:yes gene_type:complete
MVCNQFIKIMNKQSFSLTILITIVAVVFLFGTRFYVSIPAGHVGVATLFGEVQSNPFKAGLHFPINPLYQFTNYDIRERKYDIEGKVPSQDQLTTEINVTIKYRINSKDAPQILKEIGTLDDVIRVLIAPKLNSVLREQGKSIKQAEDFFQEQTQATLQLGMLEDMSAYLQERGITTVEILLREIELPDFIQVAVAEKKQREQEVEKQKAELERFRTEQQQVVAEAQAQLEAATLEAEQRKLLADAQAYEIEKLNTAIGQNPAFIQLQALEALKDISKNDSSKIYFINGESKNPLPLMHMGEALTK